MKKHQSNRRKFLKKLGNTSVLLSAGSLSAFADSQPIKKSIVLQEKVKSPNDKIRIGAVGMGIMGYNNVEDALKVPGVELVSVCDLYEGRLKHAQEKFGKDVKTTRDFRTLLDRSDIDAVFISTSDNWHGRIATEALDKGKHVYCEKPMVKSIEEGLPLIKKQREKQKVFQVGSQLVSNQGVLKAKELYNAGVIGKLNSIEASFDRQSALGAWQYTLPTDSSPQTVDWDRYIEGLDKSPYDENKFFRWRNYKEFGTGVAGDLFVHLLSTIHTITGSLGPTKIFANGQLCYWKDGRNVPDVMNAIMEYPETTSHSPFLLSLRVNFISGTGPNQVTRLIGETGSIEFTGGNVAVNYSIMSEAPGIGGWDSLDTYPDQMQEILLSQYDERYSQEQKRRPKKDPEIYEVTQQNAHLDHITNFFDGIKTGQPVVEDAEFGFRAAAPCLACNESYFNQKIIHWDPVKMKLKN